MALFRKITNRIIQKKNPMEKYANENALGIKSTPATGTSIFPTTGINQAGFINCISKLCCIQNLIVWSIIIVWDITPTHQNSMERKGQNAEKARDINKNEIEIAEKKLIFILWLKSAFTSSKYLIAFNPYKNVKSKKSPNVKNKRPSYRNFGSHCIW